MVTKARQRQVAKISASRNLGHVSGPHRQGWQGRTIQNACRKAGMELRPPATQLFLCAHPAGVSTRTAMVPADHRCCFLLFFFSIHLNPVVHAQYCGTSRLWDSRITVSYQFRSKFRVPPS